MVGEMTNGGRIRQPFPGARDLTSTEGSEYGPVEFTREDVDALLHERIKYKSKYNYKLLGDVTIANGGVMPNIHNLLLPNKKAGSQCDKEDNAGKWFDVRANK